MWKLKQVEVTKLLGVTLDCKLLWSKHFDATVAKVGRGLSIIKCCSAFLTTISTRQVLQALVLSHLDYCSVVWLSATKENCNWLITGQHGWPVNVHRELTIICMSISPGSEWRRYCLYHYLYLWEVECTKPSVWTTGAQLGHPCIPHKTCDKRSLHSPQVKNRLWEAHSTT